MTKKATEQLQFSTITIPTPIKEITSLKNCIVTNEGEFYLVEVWFDDWQEEILANVSEEKRLHILNEVYIAELNSGFVFNSELEARLFLATMANLTGRS